MLLYMSTTSPFSISTNPLKKKVPTKEDMLMQHSESWSRVPLNFFSPGIVLLLLLVLQLCCGEHQKILFLGVIRRHWGGCFLILIYCGYTSGILWLMLLNISNSEKFCPLLHFLKSLSLIIISNLQYFIWWFYRP